ncbi:hypothetical protein LINGRAPRIM_LOCUS384 [Linum grandiflorum]
MEAESNNDNSNHAPIVDSNGQTLSFNSELARQFLGIAIKKKEIPLSIADNLYFKQFVSIVQPLFQVPSRNTMKKLISDNEGKMNISELKIYSPRFCCVVANSAM